MIISWLNRLSSKFHVCIMRTTTNIASRLFSTDARCEVAGSYTCMTGNEGRGKRPSLATPKQTPCNTRRTRPNHSPYKGVSSIETGVDCATNKSTQERIAGEGGDN